MVTRGQSRRFDLSQRVAGRVPVFPGRSAQGERYGKSTWSHRALPEQQKEAARTTAESAGEAASFAFKRYLSEFLIASNLLESTVPSAFTAVMMANPMPAAMSAYSIDVAPDSSLVNAAICFFTMKLL